MVKKTPPEKITKKKCAYSLTYPVFSSAKYKGKSDAELETLYAEERKEAQRRKQASERT